MSKYKRLETFIDLAILKSSLVRVIPNLFAAYSFVIKFPTSFPDTIDTIVMWRPFLAMVMIWLQFTFLRIRTEFVDTCCENFNLLLKRGFIFKILFNFCEVFGRMQLMIFCGQAVVKHSFYNKNKHHVTLLHDIVISEAILWILVIVLYIVIRYCITGYKSERNQKKIIYYNENPFFNFVATFFMFTYRFWVFNFTISNALINRCVDSISESYLSDMPFFEYVFLPNCWRFLEVVASAFFMFEHEMFKITITDNFSHKSAYFLYKLMY